MYLCMYIQGRVGNCYFLAAIASCADGEGDLLIKDLIIEEGIEQERGMTAPWTKSSHTEHHLLSSVISHAPSLSDPFT